MQNLNNEKYTKIPSINEPREILCEQKNLPVVDQRFIGIPQEVVDQDQARQRLICHLARQVLNSPKKHELMQELFPEGRTLTPVNDQSKEVIKEQGNVEAFQALGTYEQDPVYPLIATDT